MQSIQYSQRLEASLPVDNAGAVLVEPAALAVLRLIFADFLQGEDECDFDRRRLLQISIISSWIFFKSKKAFQFIMYTQDT